MTGTPTAEVALAQLEAQQFDSEGDAMGMVAVAVAAINREVDGGTDEGRIRRLVDRPYAEVRRIAERFSARTFSITVGLPLGVGVSIEWGIEGPADRALGRSRRPR